LDWHLCAHSFTDGGNDRLVARQQIESWRRQEIKIKPAATIILILIIVVSVLYYRGLIPTKTNETTTTWSKTNQTTSISSTLTEVQQYDLIEKMAFTFIVEKMMNSQGGIFSTYRSNYPISYSYGTNHEVLAESVRLLLYYAYLVNNRTLFNIEYNLAKNYLIGPYDVFYWKLSANMSPFKGQYGQYGSASIDDLKMAEAMLLGYEAWKDPDYLKFAERISEGIRLHEVHPSDQILVEWFNWDSKANTESSHYLKLSYADSSAIKKITQYSPVWAPVLNNTMRIVAGGIVPSTGLAYDYYDIPNTRYLNLDQYVDSIYEIWTGMNLWSAGLTNSSTRLYTFFKTHYMKDGVVHTSYNPMDGTSSKYEAGPGTYALLIRLALRVGDLDFAKSLFEQKLLTFQEVDPGSELFAAFTTEWPGSIKEANSFDNLTSIVAIRELKQAMTGTLIWNRMSVVSQRRIFSCGASLLARKSYLEEIISTIF